MFCKNCGAKKETDAQFCPNCGKNISQSILTKNPDLNSSKKITRGEKIKAGIIGWIGGGIVWYIFGVIGWTNSDNIIGMLIALFVTIFVWVKLYRYYLSKWTKEFNINR
jgi:uncharacterized membrane protein YvbJ